MDTSNYNNKVCCFGEILWDILPDGPQPGGAPFNVAYHLTKLKITAGLISKTGEDPEGQKLRELLTKWNIDKSLLQSDPVNPTGKVLAFLGKDHEVKYEIVHPVAWDFIEPDDKAIAAVKNASYFVYGSLAARSKISRDTLFQFLEHARYKVFDINLRPPFFEKELLKSLLEKADMLKINREEFGIVWKMFGNKLSSEAEQVNFIKEKWSIKEVVMTRGANGASYFTENNNYHNKGIPVNVSDTIGSGDAFLAAFIAGHLHKEDPGQILKEAVAMGSFIATKKGGCPEYELPEYQDFVLKRTSP